MEQDQDIIELLKPRYKVIADYPRSEHKIGDIIQFTHYGELPMQMVEEPKKSWLTDFIDKPNTGGVMYSEDGFIPYPSLFKKLEWWEERKPNELPFYLRATKKGEQMGFTGVLKVMNYAGKYKNGCLDHVRFENGEPGTLAWFLPATQSEYENQNK